MKRTTAILLAAFRKRRTAHGNNKQWRKLLATAQQRARKQFGAHLITRWLVTDNA